MIDFWAQIAKSDVEKFAKSLILPAYMSHLKIAPFSISDQVDVATGREPLKIVYLGEGRLEELTLEPSQYAEKLLASLSVGLDVQKIRTPTSGAIWTWNEIGPTHPFFSVRFDDERQNEVAPNESVKIDATLTGESSNEAAKFIRVYFERKVPINVSKTFPARDAYVSVSRREIFLSWRVVESYARAAVLDLLKDVRSQAQKNADRPVPIDGNGQDGVDRVDFAWNRSFQPFDETLAEKLAEPTALNIDALKSQTPIQPPPSLEIEAAVAPRRQAEPKFRFQLDGRRAMFRYGQIAGSFSIDSSEFLDEAFRFAGLTQSLTYLDEYVRRVPQAFEPQLDESGVRVRLAVVETKNTNDDAP